MTHWTPMLRCCRQLWALPLWATLACSSPLPSGVPDAAGTCGESGAGASDGGAREPADAGAAEHCAASAEGDVPLGQDTFVANTGKSEVSALTYTNVGATSAYAQVVDGWSRATGCVGDSDGSLCKNTYRKPRNVSGPLAPFDEENREKRGNRSAAR